MDASTASSSSSFIHPHEAEYLRDDINVHTVLLESLDDDSDSDVQKSRKSIKRTLKRLKKRLALLESRTKPDPDSEPHIKSDPEPPTPRRQFKPNSGPRIKPDPDRPTTPPRHSPTTTHQLDGMAGEPSPPMGPPPHPSFLSPNSFDLVSRKRQRGELDNDLPHPKSRRQSPSNPATPATDTASPAPSHDSSTSIDFDDPVLGSLLGGYTREDDEEEKAYFAEIAARQKQEKEDAEMARRLQAEIDRHSAPPPQQRPTFPANSSTQSFFRADGSINRSLPRPAAMPSFNALPPSFNQPASLDSMQTVKSENRPPTPSWPPAPSIGSPYPSSTSDSDVEEISAQDFTTHYDTLNRAPRPYGPSVPTLVRGTFAGPVPGAFTVPGAFPGGPFGNVAGTHVYGAPVHSQPQQSLYLGSTGMANIINGASSAVNGALNALGFGGSSSDPYDVDMYARFRQGFADQGKTEEDIKNLLRQIRPDEDLSEEERSHMPEGLKLPLMKHQAAGVAWMKRMEESTNKGGILADDMGLGKTLQTIALMLARPPPTTGERQPTLIVAPLALLRQWKEELTKFVENSHRMNVLILHGQNRPTKWIAIRAYDVVITTYPTLAAELKRKAVFEEKRKHIPEAIPTGKEEYPLLGDRSVFHRVVLDEAQNIKNKLTKAALAACLLKSTHRWCLTGTPMQNSTEEMYSLIKFCRIPPYHSWDKFNVDIGRPLKNSGTLESTKERAMQRLQALLKGIMLRRNKKSEIDGKPILQLPAKNTVEDRAHFEKDQLDFYQALETKAQIQFNKYVRAGTVGRNYSNALVLLLRLRQACCHPHLITNTPDFVAAIGDLANMGADFKRNAKALKPEVVARLKESCEAMECPVCMDANDNPVIFACGHGICNDCLSRLTDAVVNNDGEGSKATCPHCRASIDATKITNLISFLKVHCPDDERVQNLPVEENADDADSDSDDSSDDSSDDEDDDGDLRDFIVKDDDEIEYDSDASDKKDYKKKLLKDSASNSRASSKSRSKGKGKGKGKAKSTGKSNLKGKSLAELRKEGLKSKAAKKKYLKKLAKDYIPSAKIEKTLALLEEIRDHGEGEKTIIFSSFTSFLDLLEVPLAAHADLNVYERYDGSMSRSDREDAIYRFKEKKECKVMLVSLKAGNSGLNLTAANHVIILDPFWNPFVEYQAADRCYRIGQLREVTIHRILIGQQGKEYGKIADGEDGDDENNFTVEDRILKLQEKKKHLVEMALDERAGERIGRLGARELGYLFGVNSLN